ncbi:hypothetical protein ASF48_08960 [Rathayibacter sp. Leaf299]|uniref:hypothetical protein n=1 Tax=Rathayibacter sp. Leaf299 TaxID=1736328 RepID=UPI0006F80EAD|nr:hypothetical protein [Rathayibacter sp. Leaf299]KQQ20719.1 hypothetical protein ASF48_08960 [Rathayibacter sp. Leaf299]
MTIQPIFHVPSDIAAGLLNGDFIRHGGVVRDAAGRVVTHLKEIPSSSEAVEELAKHAALNLRNPWVVAVGVGALALVAVGGGVVLALKKWKKDAEPNVPECVQSYNLSLRAYFEAIQSGSLDASIIERLIADLDAVLAYGENGVTTVAFSPEQLATLTRVVLEYTSELAKANGTELNQAEATSEGGVVVDLRRYLAAQKRIFDEAA